MAALAAATAAAIAPPSRLDLMLLDHEFREIYRGASVRADGSTSRGRKAKHDAATRRWIDTIGFPMCTRCWQWESSRRREIWRCCGLARGKGSMARR